MNSTKVRCGIAAIFALVTVWQATPFARADDAADAAARAALRERYRDLHVAMRNRDTKALGAMFSPDFKSKDISGRETTATQMLAEIGALPPDPKRFEATTLGPIAIDGARAVVQQQVDFTTRKTAPDGRERRLHFVFHSVDTWVRTGATWLLDATETTSSDLSIDGVLAAHEGDLPAQSPIPGPALDEPADPASASPGGPMSPSPAPVPSPATVPSPARSSPPA